MEFSPRSGEVTARGVSAAGDAGVGGESVPAGESAALGDEGVEDPRPLSRGRKLLALGLMAPGVGGADRSGNVVPRGNLMRDEE